jgi:hypothetical protein
MSLNIGIIQLVKMNVVSTIPFTILGEKTAASKSIFSFGLVTALLQFWGHVINRLNVPYNRQQVNDRLGSQTGDGSAPNMMDRYQFIAENSLESSSLLCELRFPTW